MARKALSPGAAVAAILALTVALCIYYMQFEVIDDAYISFRYAENLVEGHGLVFNIGERVEGYTNFLWVILLAGPAYLGVDIVFAGKLFGGLCAFMTVWATVFLLSPLRSPPAWRQLLAPMLLVSNLTFTMWAVHGLETALFAFLLTMGARSDLRAQANDGSHFTSGLWFALATLTRPEGASVFVASLAYHLLADRRRWLARRGWLGLLPYTAIVSAHLLWRLSYYGYPLPNTFYAKAGLSWPVLMRGLEYVSAFFADPRSLGLLLVFVALFEARHDSRLRYLLWILAAYLAGVVLEGGDAFPGFRFLVPVFPLLYTVVQEAVVALLANARSRASARTVVLAGTVGLALWIPHVTHMRAGAYAESRGGDSFTRDVKLVGLLLKERFPAGTTIAANPVGALSYYSGFHVYDLLGLTDEHIAHSAVGDLGTGLAGHEKGDGYYVFEKKPDVFLLGNVLIREEPPSLFMQGTWPTLMKSESEFVMHPELTDWYSRDALRLPDGRYLYFLRKKGIPVLAADEAAVGGDEAGSHQRRLSPSFSR